MKPPRPTQTIGRKRRTLGWTTLTLGLLVAGMWVASGWWGYRFESVMGRTWMSYGEVRFTSEPMPDFPSTNWWRETKPAWNLAVQPLFRDRADTDLIVVAFKKNALYSTTHFVFWPIPLILCTPAALLLRSGILARRRAITGTCTRCGYSLAGLAGDSPCPECGKGAMANA